MFNPYKELAITIKSCPAIQRTAFIITNTCCFVIATSFLYTFVQQKIVVHKIRIRYQEVALHHLLYQNINPSPSQSTQICQANNQWLKYLIVIIKLNPSPLMGEGGRSSDEGEYRIFKIITTQF